MLQKFCIHNGAKAPGLKVLHLSLKTCEVAVFCHSEGSEESNLQTNRVPSIRSG